MEIEDLLSSFENVTRIKNGWSALCPAHDDTNPSLSISRAPDGKVLIHCHAGCATSDILAAVDLKMADLFSDSKAAPASGERRIMATYSYLDENGRLLFEVVRYAPKDFLQRRPDGNGGHIWNLQGVRRVLYHLPGMRADIADGVTVYVVEGEKDADALRGIGRMATCNSGGAGRWTADYTATLAGAKAVVIIADKDAAGRKHAHTVASALQGKVTSVKVLELPDRAGRKVKDAADWLAAGGTVEELRGLVETAPELATTAASAGAIKAGDKERPSLPARLLAILQDRGLPTAEEKRAKMTPEVLGDLHQRGQFFFHDGLNDHKTSMFFDREQHVLMQLASDRFQSWLAFFTGLNRSTPAFDYVMASIEDEALAGKTSGITPEKYWTRRDSAVYISNGDGRLVKITAGGAEELDNGTDDVVFACGCTLAPWKLTTPVDPFTTCSLWRSMKCSTPHGLDLLRLWTLTVPLSLPCKPPLVMSGAIRSGKTAAARGLFTLFGITEIIGKIQEGDAGESGFWAVMNGGGLAVFDNVDSNIKWLPDALSAASTGGSSSKRRLYTDGDIAVLRPNAWPILTTANPMFASDVGLADRLLVVRMTSRATDDTAESVLFEEVRSIRDGGLSFIANAIHLALADTATSPKGLNGRHPDWAAWAWKLGRAIGRQNEAEAAIRAAEGDKAVFMLESDDVGKGLLNLLRQGKEIKGSAVELLQQLRAGDESFDTGYWTPRRVGKRLSKIKIHLDAVATVKESISNGTTTYFIKSKSGFGVFGEAVSAKPHKEAFLGTLPQNTPGNPPNPLVGPHTPPPGVFFFPGQRRLDNNHGLKMDTKAGGSPPSPCPVPATVTAVPRKHVLSVETELFVPPAASRSTATRPALGTA